MKELLLLIIMAGVILIASPAMSEVYTWSQDGANFTFDDWGFKGPDGRGYKDFAPTKGVFGYDAVLDPTGGIGQIQHVTTLAGDGLTPDQPSPAYPDIVGTNFIQYDAYPIGLVPTYSANMDSMTNFFQWGYTSPAGSLFDNMQIDYDGDYLVPKQGMQFAYFDLLDYKNDTGDHDGSGVPFQDFTAPTYFSFQPYAISDATGWCGSILADHPAALEAMAGQVIFDIAFELYTSSGAQQLQTQYIPGFEMRSYGTLNIDVPPMPDGTEQHFEASAVVNNTNPSSGNKSVGPNTPVDPDYYNKVSFMGGGIIPAGAWVLEWWVDVNGVHVEYNDPDFATKAVSVDTSKTVIADEFTAGAEWHNNAFAGRAFMLRADADRTIDYFDEAYYGPAPAIIPEPGSFLLMASGLMGLVALKRSRRS